MHRRLNETYSSSCCSHQAELDAGWYKKVRKAFRKAVKAIHEQKTFTPDSLNDKRIQLLINETYKVLKEGVNTGITTKVPAAMINKLDNDVFVFSGMKTYAQLKEASLLLRDANGQIKPFDAFARDIEKINSNYNQNYLRAEHQFAIGSAQAAAQWHEYAKDGDRYNLQIRTAGDDKVRASHQELNMITLPQSDPYWKTTYTPFDWGCRCRIIQVLKSKYPVTDTGTATMAADKAISTLFRYNPGLQQTIFPPKHPYYPQHCNGEKLNVSGLVGFAKWLLDAEADRCKAMQVVKQMRAAAEGATIKKRAAEYDDLKKDENYNDVAFNKNTGGLKATHKLHNFDPNRGHYEKEVRDILFAKGNKIILENESTGEGKKVDGFLNDLKADISTIIGTGKNTTTRALLHSKSKGADTAILYYPEESNYSPEKVNNAIARFKGQTSYRFKKVVVIVKGDIVRQ